MSKAASIAIASAIAGSMALSTPSPAGATPGHTDPVAGLPASQQDQPLRTVAMEAVHKSMDLERRLGDANTNVLSQVARSHYALFGWNSPTGDAYLRRVLAAEHRGGGWDVSATANLSTRPTQVVSTGDHVGPLLIQAYQKGKVPRATIERTVKFILASPTLPGPNGSYCINPATYASDFPDVTKRGKKYCRTNMSTSAAWFLWAAEKEGVYVPGQWTMRTKALQYDRYQRRLAGGRWSIQSDVSRVQDLDHNALNAIVHRETGNVNYGNSSINDGFPTGDIARDPDSGLLDSSRNPSYMQPVLNSNARLRLSMYSPRGKCYTARADARKYLGILDSLPDSRTKMVRYAQLSMYASNLANTCGPVLKESRTYKLDVRSGPSSRYSKVQTISRGNTVTVLWRRSGDWVEVRVEGTQRTGWVLANDLV